MTIRKADLQDAAAICNIYNYHVTNTVVTFEETEITVEEMKARITELTAKFPWLVYEADNKVIGYAYAGVWKTRHAYRYCVESSIYLAEGSHGQGIGSLLYRDLLDQLKSIGIHAVIGGIALPNAGSIALHEKFGFEKIGHFREVGFKFGEWIDVGYWEKIL